MSTTRMDSTQHASLSDSGVLVLVVLVAFEVALVLVAPGVCVCVGGWVDVGGSRGAACGVGDWGWGDGRGYSHGRRTLQLKIM